MSLLLKYLQDAGVAGKESHSAGHCKHGARAVSSKMPITKVLQQDKQIVVQSQTEDNFQFLFKLI